MYEQMFFKSGKPKQSVLYVSNFILQLQQIVIQQSFKVFMYDRPPLYHFLPIKLKYVYVMLMISYLIKHTYVVYILNF